MQVLKLEVEDDLVDKVLWFLKNIKGIKIKESFKNETFIEECKRSLEDYEKGNYTEITDIDKYIKDLENEIS